MRFVTLDQANIFRIIKDYFRKKGSKVVPKYSAIVGWIDRLKAELRVLIMNKKASNKQSKSMFLMI